MWAQAQCQTLVLPALCDGALPGFAPRRRVDPGGLATSAPVDVQLSSACRTSIREVACFWLLGSMPQARRRRQVGFHRWRVLVVEDDDSFAEALRDLLEADGRLEVAGTARDGREGVELAEALRPDVVLMDIVLPVMDGLEATREIRRRQPTIAVVAITGWEYEERALEVQDAGAVDFVGKGRLGPDLVEIVVAAAKRRRRRRGRPSG
jgi:CheY-like chemotaxis protein